LILIRFEHQGFALHPKGLHDADDNLTLVGVGMRRKNLFIVDVDVYQVGLNLSPIALAKAKAWKTIGNFKYSLVEMILQIPPRKMFGDVEETSVSIILRFVRPVSKDQIVAAFDEALVGLDKQVLADFKDALSKATSGGLKKGDEICFHWPKHGGLIVSSGDYISHGIESDELAKRLLEVYIDDHRTVSKDLLQCFKDNIDLIETE